MTRNWLALGACVLMLGGCAHLSSRQAFPRHYTLTAEPSPTRSSRAPAPDATLQVARIAVAPWLQGTDLFYRLDYRHDDRIAAYAQSDWVSPPAKLLETMIQNTLAAGGHWRIVTGLTGPASTAFALHVQLNDFSQAFATPQQSDGVLDATATLVANRDGSVVAQRHFHVRAAAPTPDAEGGVKALNQAALQFATGLEQWLRAIPLKRNESP